MDRDQHAPDRRAASAADATTTAPQVRRVRFLLRNQRLLDGMVHLPDGVDLAAFLSTREGGWVNVTDARWLATGERVSHLVLKSGLVLWAGAVAEGDDLLPRDADATPRAVKITLENRITLHAELRLPAQRRLTDLLTACGSFFPVCDARVDERGIAFGDIAVNRDAVHLVEDLAGIEPRAAVALDLDITARYLAGGSQALVDPFRPVTLDELEQAATVAAARLPQSGAFDPGCFQQVTPAALA
jgi:hypothetical protein